MGYLMYWRHYRVPLWYDLTTFQILGQNLSNFLLVFWSKRWHQKDILKLIDLYSFFYFNFMDNNITESWKFKHNFNKALALLWYVYVNIEIPRLIQSETDWNLNSVKASNFRLRIHITDQYNFNNGKNLDTLVTLATTDSPS